MKITIEEPTMHLIMKQSMFKVYDAREWAYIETIKETANEAQSGNSNAQGHQRTYRIKLLHRRSKQS